ncbi:alpha-2-glucosyltransferase Alg10, partial [Pilobolus umbonatus]
DEIFHIPQAQQYCHGDYVTWDPKLTTPPGLYNIIEWIGHWLNYDLCTVPALRSTNLLFSVCLYFVLYLLITTLHPTSMTSLHYKLYTLALCWFPVGYFYNFIYYTDTGSTFFVLLSYYLLKKRWYKLSGMIGFLSLTFRQTNVIWLCLFMMLTIIDVIEDANERDKKKERGKRELYNPLAKTVDQIIHCITSLCMNFINHFWTIIPPISTYIMSILSFAIFVIWNKGIVLGDRSNHIAGLHYPQLFYYTSFLSFFALPWLLSRDNIFSALSISKRKWTYVLVLSSCYLVYKYTYEHPFILSDNRHYSFYVWKNIYRRHWSIRYLLVPVYLMSGYLNLKVLGNSIFCQVLLILILIHLFIANDSSLLFIVGYIVTLILTLVPSPLLEFRYFILPFLFYMVHIQPRRMAHTVMAVVYYTVINGITLYLFNYRPFRWTSEPDVYQRFMW